MGKIAVHEFVSLDGVFEAPSWTADYGFTDAMGEAIGRLTKDASAILLGRTTFELFAPAWSSRTAEDDPGAPFFNDTPKHVVSGSLEDPEGAWQRSSVLGPYSAARVRGLKEREEGGIYVSGSGRLVRAMLADGLVDELHLLVYPLVLGAGERLFPEGSERVALSLLDHEAFDNGVTHLVYGPGEAA